ADATPLPPYAPHLCRLLPTPRPVRQRPPPSVPISCRAQLTRQNAMRAPVLLQRPEKRLSLGASARFPPLSALVGPAPNRARKFLLPETAGSRARSPRQW